MNSCLGGNLGLLLKTAPRENFQEQPFQVRWNGDQSLIQHKEKSNVDTTNALGELVFDNLYRLTSESISGGLNNGTIDYTYDKVSNRTSRNSSVAGVSNQSHSHTKNDLLSHHTYDDNGSTIASPDLVNKTGKTADVYDFRNKLIRRTSDSGDVINLSYNADGHRVKKISLKGMIRFLVDNNNPTGYSQVVEEQNVAGSLMKVYHYGHSRIAMDDFLDGNNNRRRHFYSLDGHGSVRALTDADGGVKEEYDFDSYGILIGFRKHDGTSMVERSVDDFASLSVNTFLFAGEEWDADMGMYYNRARYLDVENGRFNAMDDWEGVNGNPVTLNKYLYTDGNPVSMVDPTGNFSVTSVMSAVSIRFNTFQRRARPILKATDNVTKLTLMLAVVNNMQATVSWALNTRDYPMLRVLPRAMKYNYELLKEFRDSNKKLSRKLLGRVKKLATLGVKMATAHSLGLPIKLNGLPAFAKYRSRNRGVVFIKLSGRTRSQDDTRANRARAGLPILKRIPRGKKIPTGSNTWHHHEVVGIMELVESSKHNAIKHDGGVKFYEMLKGVNYIR